MASCEKSFMTDAFHGMPGRQYCLRQHMCSLLQLQVESFFTSQATPTFNLQAFFSTAPTLSSADHRPLPWWQ